MDDAPYTGDLDLDAVNTRDDLAALLRTVRVRADKPSLRTLEARTRHTLSPLSKTTLADMLNGVRFPSKARMLAFLRACGVKNDSMESWQHAWERVAAEEEPAQPRAIRTALGTGNAILAEQPASPVAGEAANEERTERTRSNPITAVRAIQLTGVTTTSGGGRISHLGMLYPDHVYSAYVYSPDRPYGHRRPIRR